MSYAQGSQSEQEAAELSLELLEMLGQFEAKDESWLENEMNQQTDKTGITGNDEQSNISEKIYD